MKYHHTTELEQKCPDCEKPFLMYWEDAEEKNGHSQRMYGFDEVCFNCSTIRNNGEPPKSLHQINKERSLIKQ